MKASDDGTPTKPNRVISVNSLIPMPANDIGRIRTIDKSPVIESQQNMLISIPRVCPKIIIIKTEMT